MNVSVIEMDSEENIWIGTSGYGLLKYDGLKFTTYKTEDGLPNNNINDIIETILKASLPISIIQNEVVMKKTTRR